jgi:hypothetical protein
MMKFSPPTFRFIIQHSMFDIRYSFRAHGKPVVIELPATKRIAGTLAFRSTDTLSRRLRHKPRQASSANQIGRSAQKFRASLAGHRYAAACALRHTEAAFGPSAAESN